jgi:dihydroorotase-like cyclic amidohydrolase
MGNSIILPGLIDIHVHLRDPGQTHKENFFTGSSAALAGGYTRIFDMPNNAKPIFTAKDLDEKLESANRQIVCDMGFYFGSQGDNLSEFSEVISQVSGLKLYLNKTTGGYILDVNYLLKIFNAWGSSKPVLVHAEADVIDDVMRAVRETGQSTHICHVSCEAELKPIIAAKLEGLPVSCGVTPHHLFLTGKDTERLGVYGRMKPELKPQSDFDYLWDHFDQIDVVESDHAPHTIKEKQDGAFGVPGLETTLPLLLQAVRENRLTMKDIIEKCDVNPRKILGLKAENDTHIEVEPIEYKIRASDLKSKCKWTPFDGMTVFGKVKKVIIRSKLVYEDGKVLAKPGDGKLLIKNS